MFGQADLLRLLRSVRPSIGEVTQECLKRESFVKEEEDEDDMQAAIGQLLKRIAGPGKLVCTKTEAPQPYNASFSPCFCASGA